METIHQGVFCKYQNLRRVVLNEGLEVLGTNEYTGSGRPFCGVFQESVVEDVRLPSTLKRIECYAFQNCKRLKKIVFPDGFEFVGRYCFWGSGLQEARISSTGIRAAPDAFVDCPAYRNLTVRGGRLFSDGK